MMQEETKQCRVGLTMMFFMKEFNQKKKTNPSQKMPKTSFFLPFVVENIDRVWKQTSHCGEVVQSHLQVVLQQRQSNMQMSIYGA
jgi:hypothetical protein